MFKQISSILCGQQGVSTYYLLNVSPAAKHNARCIWGPVPEICFSFCPQKCYFRLHLRFVTALGCIRLTQYSPSFLRPSGMLRVKLHWSTADFDLCSLAWLNYRSLLQLVWMDLFQRATVCSLIQLPVISWQRPLVGVINVEVYFLVCNYCSAVWSFVYLAPL